MNRLALLVVAATLAAQAAAIWRTLGEWNPDANVPTAAGVKGTP